jgi:hypothetical protein
LTEESPPKGAPTWAVARGVQWLIARWRSKKIPNPKRKFGQKGNLFWVVNLGVDSAAFDIRVSGAGFKD